MLQSDNESWEEFMNAWRYLFHEFLGWNEKQVAVWAEDWRHTGEQGGLYHESPAYYASPTIVRGMLGWPIIETHSELYYIRLEVHRLLDRANVGIPRCDPEKWPEAIEKVRALILHYKKKSDQP